MACGRRLFMAKPCLPGFVVFFSKNVAMAAAGDVACRVFFARLSIVEQRR